MLQAPRCLDVAHDRPGITDEFRAGAGEWQRRRGGDPNRILSVFCCSGSNLENLRDGSRA